MERLKQSGLAAYRKERLGEQNGRDPITSQPIENPCVDHDHVTGHVRQVLDRDTNAFEGKVFNAWRRYLRHRGVTLLDAISGLYGYYCIDYTKNPLHPKHRTPDEKRIRRNKRAKKRRKNRKPKTP